MIMLLSILSKVNSLLAQELCRSVDGSKFKILNKPVLPDKEANKLNKVDVNLKKDWDWTIFRYD